MITDLEDNWYCLIEELEKGNVIPIVGPELLEIPDGPDGVSALLYDLVARELAARYNHASEDKISGVWSLHNCVAALLASGQVNVDKVRRAAAKTIDTLSAACPLPKALQTLAAIDAFDLYVSLTCDPLLFRSLLNVDPSAESFAFGIRSDTNSHPSTSPPSRGEKFATSCLARPRTCSISPSMKVMCLNTCTAFSPNRPAPSRTCSGDCAAAICFSSVATFRTGLAGPCSGS